MTIRPRPAGLAVLACGLLTACGWFGGRAAGVGGGTGAGPGRPQVASQGGVTADPGAADLVEAVSAGRSPGPIDLQFALQQKPQAGRPLTVRLRLTPAVAVDRVEAHFLADEGLDIHDGSYLEGLDHPQVGVGAEHQLTLVPTREGVYAILATVTTTAQDQSLSRTYSIPIIVGPDTSSAPGPGGVPVPAPASSGPVAHR